MNFAKLFHKTNLSLNHLRGSVIQCSVEQIDANKVLLNTGLKELTLCVQSELGVLSQPQKGQLYYIEVENAEWFGEPKVVLPRLLQKRRTRKSIWLELTKIWQSTRNRVKGLILNRVNGGYAVAVGGYIAFLPRSLTISKRACRSQRRTFSILKMNPKIHNIVVKELGTTQRTKTIQHRFNPVINYKHTRRYCIQSNIEECYETSVRT
jgi:ribosomal protein S1